MCSTGNSSGSLAQFGMKLPGQSPYLSLGPQQLSYELQRAQLQEYSQRLQMGFRSYPGQVAALNQLSYHGQLGNPYLHPYFYKDPRARFIHEEPKPSHSYIGLIAMAILSVRDQKLVLSDIYQWILDNYNYFRTRGPGWRNSIRHNLSLNDCFIKSGRSANGKGHYWAIHPANLEDFIKGDFRRRRAQRRVRKHMGLSVPDDEDDDSPAPSPTPIDIQSHASIRLNDDQVIDLKMKETVQSETHDDNVFAHDLSINSYVKSSYSGQSDSKPVESPKQKTVKRKRMFDIDSLLAPDTHKQFKVGDTKYTSDGGSNDAHTSGSGSTSDQSDESSSKDGEQQRSHSPFDTNSYCRSDKSPRNSPDSRRDINSDQDDRRSMEAALPHYVSFMQKTGTNSRMSAFRNASQFTWPSITGNLSNYHHLIALNSSNHRQGSDSVAASMETSQRWQQYMNNMNTLVANSQIKENAISVSDD